jgi:DNA-binding ferritin-like protein (Dps family)
MYSVPEPFQFNPLKHHLVYIREYIYGKLSEEAKIDLKILLKEIRHIGTSVMDVYTGRLPVGKIFKEVQEFLEKNKLTGYKVFSNWTGINFSDFKIVTLSDSSQWMLKYHNNQNRYVHIFPARLSPHTFRVKANTLKSAILYYIIIGKDYISRRDLNHARSLLGLSPVKDPLEAEAITEMIEIIRF